eukprot:m.26949 g.26949  ORF g.26949 m.26949 type:complete len:65 (-) comp8889_c0_seq2:362-556(-)
MIFVSKALPHELVAREASMLEGMSNERFGMKHYASPRSLIPMYKGRYRNGMSDISVECSVTGVS